MKKWILFLALLLCFGCACADGEGYYTNNQDRYYHTDPDCDRPETARWWTDAERVVFDRACYQKYPISEEAALAFEKKACPICVTRFEPVYLGEHMMEWEYDFAPWGIGDRMGEWGNPLGPAEYQAEVQDTYERFAAHYAETYKRGTGEAVREHPYPDFYAGCWRNNADGYSYAVVDPTQEIVDRFKEKFGGGAWIVPAKYGYNEIKAIQDPIFDMVEEWGENHPEFDLRVVSSAVHANYLEVGIYGDTWEEAMPMLDAELDIPIWVCFIRNNSYFDAENMWY